MKTCPCKMQRFFSALMNEISLNFFFFFTNFAQNIHCVCTFCKSGERQFTVSYICSYITRVRQWQPAFFLYHKLFSRMCASSSEKNVCTALCQHAYAARSVFEDSKIPNTCMYKTMPNHAKRTQYHLKYSTDHLIFSCLN